MTIYKAIITFNIPNNVRKEEFEQWLEYHIFQGRSYPLSNPLLDKEIYDFVSNLSIRQRR